jgi:hypothetical protein
MSCAFCHICDSSERKRRQKVRKSHLKTNGLICTLA